MNKEMKCWVGKHRRGLNKAWKAELKAREIGWNEFCTEMWNIWNNLAGCQAKETNHA